MMRLSSPSLARGIRTLLPLALLALLSMPLAQAQVQDDVTVVLEPDRLGSPMAAHTGVGVEGGGGYYTATNAKLNTVFRVLAEKCDLQYFASPDIESLTLTGQLNVDQPRQTILDLAASFNLIAYDNGKTLFIRSKKSMEDIPARAISYELRYLRQDKIVDLIDAMLTPGKGRVRLEPKTNVLLIEDNDYVLTGILDWLAKVDVPKRQISIQLQVLKLGDNYGQDTGIDWSSTLGAAGYTISNATSASLNSLFNLPNDAGPFSFGPTAGILNPAAINVVLHALANVTKMETGNNANIVLEDNEAGLIANVDRYPIITYTASSSTGTSGADFIPVQSTVRYKIDQDDPTPSATNPGRELGVSMSVTPTCLPDGTIRLDLAPRVASITQLFPVSTGIPNVPNSEVPEVAESRSTSKLRVPDGQSLLLGGFYDTTRSITDAKVPILGDIPVIGFFFKDHTTSNVKTRLVFIITPTSFDPVAADGVMRVNDKMGNSLLKRPDAHFVPPTIPDLDKLPGDPKPPKS